MRDISKAREDWIIMWELLSSSFNWFQENVMCLKMDDINFFYKLNITIWEQQRMKVSYLYLGRGV